MPAYTIYAGPKKSQANELTHIDEPWSLDQVHQYLAAKYGEGVYTVGYRVNDLPKRKKFYVNEFNQEKLRTAYMGAGNAPPSPAPASYPGAVYAGTPPPSEMVAYLQDLLDKKLEDIREKLADVLEYIEEQDADGDGQPDWMENIAKYAGMFGNLAQQPGPPPPASGPDFAAWEDLVKKAQ